MLVQNRTLRHGMFAATERHSEDQEMLNTALHELAVALKKSPRPFMVDWLRRHHKIDNEGVPLELWRRRT